MQVGLLSVVILSLLAAGCGQEKTGAGPPPPEVEVVDVLRQDVPVFSEWIASTDGAVNATIRAQVQGYLVQQNYREGDFVRKGQLLFEIDPRPFQAALNQAEAAERQATAALTQAEATLEEAKAQVARQEALWVSAKATYDRYKPLADQRAIPRKDLDDAIGAERSSHAAIAAARATVTATEAAIGAHRAAVAAAQATAEKARLDLGFTRILSPVDGITGIAKAQVGDLVGPGSAEALTTVSTVDPIKVYIPVSEQEYLQVARARVEAGGVPVELILADGSRHPHTGRFVFADRQVDVQTGTIKVAALFPNPGNLLRPGQFARVRAQRSVKAGALLVPQRAVMELQGSYQVAVVGADQKVDIRPVKVGERVDALWMIDEGLHPGDRVVVEGLQKVRPGIVVTAKPYAAPASGTSATTPSGGSPTKRPSEIAPASPATPSQKGQR
jgi:membrane fusion protein (multidrug efflux system)